MVGLNTPQIRTLIIAFFSMFWFNIHADVAFDKPGQTQSEIKRLFTGIGLFTAGAGGLMIVAPKLLHSFNKFDNDLATSHDYGLIALNIAIVISCLNTAVNAARKLAHHNEFQSPQENRTARIIANLVTAPCGLVTFVYGFALWISEKDKPHRELSSLMMACSGLFVGADTFGTGCKNLYNLLYNRRSTND